MLHCFTHNKFINKSTLPNVMFTQDVRRNNFALILGEFKLDSALTICYIEP